MIQLQSQVLHASGVARLIFGGSTITSPTFAYSIYPDALVDQRAAAAGTLVSGSTYDVTLPQGSFVYLWMTFSATTYGPFPIEVLADDPIVNDVAEKLRGLITLNLPEIEYHLRVLVPESHNKFRVIGYKEDFDEANPPWLVVSKPRVSPSRVGVGNLNNYAIQVSLVFSVCVSDEAEDRTPAAAGVMESIITILNRSHYRVLTLASGCQIGDCFADKGTAETVSTSVVGGYRFFAIGSVNWVGQYWATQA